MPWLVDGGRALIVRRLIKPRSPRLLAGSFAIAVLCAGLVTATAFTGIGQRIEGISIDHRFSVRGSLNAPDNIVIAAIGTGHESMLEQWPLNRDWYAKAITNLSSSDVSAIVIDVPFSNKAMNPAAEDAALLTAIRTSDVPVVITSRSADDTLEARLEPPLAGVNNGASAVNAADAPVAKGKAMWAASARLPSTDNTVRTYPLWASWGNDDTLRPGVGEAAVVAARGDKLEPPKRMDIRMLNYYGPKDRFAKLSLYDISYGLTSLRDLRGKLVFIGPTDGVGKDNHDIPFDGSMSSVEIQATAAANTLDGSWLKDSPKWTNALLTGLFCIAVWTLMLTVPLGMAVPLYAVGIIGWIWYAYHLFAQGIVVPLVAPTFAGMLTFGVLSLGLAVLSVRERLRIKGLFARYVPADVVRELVERDDRINLGGESREITVLFSDIRGFTSMSESIDPAEMVVQLNEYFAAMVMVIARHRGTLDKFIGDGLMAIFGAPADPHDHAKRACDAALDMITELHQVNADRVERGLPQLQIGVGLHSGEAVVGNIGSPLFRVDFTAIGDTVNLASRLESSTKDLGAEIVVSETTAQAAGDAFQFRSLGSIVVKGRAQATQVFELTEEAALPMPVFNKN